MYIVPNLPSPLFATLQPEAKPAAASTPVAPTPKRGWSRRAHGSRQPAAADDDGVLAPSIR